MLLAIPFLTTMAADGVALAVVMLVIHVSVHAVKFLRRGV